MYENEQLLKKQISQLKQRIWEENWMFYSKCMVQGKYPSSANCRSLHMKSQNLIKKPMKVERKNGTKDGKEKNEGVYITLSKSWRQLHPRILTVIQKASQQNGPKASELLAPIRTDTNVRRFAAFFSLSFLSFSYRRVDRNKARSKSNRYDNPLILACRRLEKPRGL